MIRGHGESIKGSTRKIVMRRQFKKTSTFRLRSCGTTLLTGIGLVMHSFLLILRPLSVELAGQDRVIPPQEKIIRTLSAELELRRQQMALEMSQVL